MPLTPSQQAAVTSAHEPLFIQAGAGTGKTFTLTKRIAYGLSEQSGPLITSVDRLLTITFTNKAAGELIGRVRAELRAQGLVDEALKIDAAWISTIHSMCRRMLSSHAFDIGIDPGANLLSEEESRALAALALDSLLEDLADDPRLRFLIASNGTENALKFIRSLSELFSLAPGGKDDFDFGPRPSRANRRFVQNLAERFMEVANEIDELELPEGKQYAENHSRVMSTIETLNQWLAANQDCEWDDIAMLLSRCTPPTKHKLRAPFGELFTECKDAFSELDAVAQSALLYGQLQAASDLAIEHMERHAELKRVQGALDTNDLLIGAYELLSQNDSIAQEYRDTFQSIMVDEFQDTDSLQVGIVTMICDAALRTLATVGDAQQSIYGFRGADLEVYREMRQRMQEHGSKEVELTVNYRSQPDILRFVEDVFAKPEFFGGSFLKVDSGRDESSDPDWLSKEEPRVKILMSAGFKDEKHKRGAKVDQLRANDAAAVANEFERLHDQGASYGDMAILARSTGKTSVGAYLRELRKRGIPCVIAGGSDFFKQPEVSIVSMLLRAIADQDDDEALYSLLASDFFDVSDDDLLALSIVVKQQLRLVAEESRTKASLYDALEFYVSVDSPEPPLQKAPPSLVQAHQVLSEAIKAAQEMPLAQVMRNAISASGWKETLARRGVEGGAVFANVERSCDWVEDYETINGQGPFSASEYFRDLIVAATEGAGVRAKPGVLTSTGQDAVQIMTIHSSKGLEFPIVAVAEFDGKGRNGGIEVLSLSEDGKRHLSVKRSSKSKASEFSSDLDLSRAASQAEYLDYANFLNEEREYEEAQRLLYVALTRARDMLILVTHDSTFASTGKLSSGLASDALMAFFEDAVPREHTVLRTDGDALVEFCVSEVIPDDASPTAEDAPELRASLVVDHARSPYQEPPRIAAHVEMPRHIHSYSSLSKRDEPRTPPVAQAITLTDLSKSPDTVSAVGSAFHLVAQWLVMTPVIERQALDDRLRAAAKRYELDDGEKARLIEAIESWVSSKRYAFAQSFEHRLAEYAFCVDVEGVPLEGFIDLLCWDDDGSALVIDYKTGTSGEGEELRERYSLQASCYAYALLSTGFCSKLDMAFVRPEVGMEEVTFSFDVSDVSDLANRILER